MVRRQGAADTSGVHVETLSPDLVRTVDAIELPPVGAEVIAQAERSDAYPILVTRSPEETVERLLQEIGEAHVAVITDERVADLYGPLVFGALSKAGVRPEVAAVPAGERHKTLRQAMVLLDWLAGTQVGRQDLVVCLGGGVVIDMGGWVASAYMRGVPFVPLPTTLIGQVDAAIGGKLAVNHSTAKNLIGGFWQPRAVISDVTFLQTVGIRQLRAGLAESIKKAIIASPAYWELIDDRAEAILAGDPHALEALVHGAGVIKAELIARDPYEADSRRTLGFGHAIAHPVETVTDYSELLHGEAVAFGMAVEAQLAAARGLLSDDRLDQILGLLRRVGLPTTVLELGAELDGPRLVHAIERIRLIRGGGYRFVLPIEIGKTVIADDVEPYELMAALRICGVDP
jgi:3-dehydroquinate synthase